MFISDSLSHFAQDAEEEPPLPAPALPPAGLKVATKHVPSPVRAQGHQPGVLSETIMASLAN